MSLYQRDFILRLIEAVGATLRRALKRREENDLAGARQEIALTIGEVLGPGAAMVPMVDATTAANLVSDPQRLALYCQLLEADAELLSAMGQTDRAAAVARRATELLLELVLRRVELPDDTIARIQTLVQRTDVASLGPRYRDAAAAAMRLTSAPTRTN
ncbi:MAG: hypothetical protein IT361_10105 [Gemmatimonadaceae bacterium]|nr:hypothetical protein [Gemmatimonadaceae bacterium]